MVWSTDGAILWSKRSAHFPFSLPKGKRIEKSSFAAACFKQAKVPKRPHEVPAHFWISSSEIGKETMLWEQSKALPTYRSVISLLWMKGTTAGYLAISRAQESKPSRERPHRRGERRKPPGVERGSAYG